MAVLSLVTCSFAASATSAEAYVLRGARWPGHRITVRNTSPYRFAVSEAMRLWNSSGVRVRFRASRSRHASLVIRSQGRRATDEFGGCAGYAQLGYVRGRQ